MGKSHLTLVTPATENRTVTPKRRPNADLRSREHLTETEVDGLIQAAKRNRWGHRDSTMVLVAWRHGLRVPELVDLRPWKPCASASPQPSRSPTVFPITLKVCRLCSTSAADEPFGEDPAWQRPDVCRLTTSCVGPSGLGYPVPTHLASRNLHGRHRRRWPQDKPALLLTLRHRRQCCEDSRGKDKAAHG
jgi:hypothetical protein